MTTNSYDDAADEMEADLEHEVRNIVGSSYDQMQHPLQPARFFSERALTVTAISGAYEFASHIALAISGTPTRGLIIVQITYDLWAMDVLIQRKLRQRDVETLLRFLQRIGGGSEAHMPRNFHWSSASAPSHSNS